MSEPVEGGGSDAGSTVTTTPKWSVPTPYGHPAAVENMGTVAAPLLAGFSVTFAGLVLSTPQHFRLDSLALGLLALATLSLIASLQFTFRARLYVATPTEIEQWFDDAAEAARSKSLREEQNKDRDSYKRWASFARGAYNVGILAFLSGFAAALVPPGSVSTGRIVVLVVAIVGAALELIWVAENTLTGLFSKPSQSA